MDILAVGFLLAPTLEIQISVNMFVVWWIFAVLC